MYGTHTSRHEHTYLDRDNRTALGNLVRGSFGNDPLHVVLVRHTPVGRIRPQSASDFTRSPVGNATGSRLRIDVLHESI